MYWTAFFLLPLVASQSLRPHIFIILADDLGWNDVGFHGASEIPTPNLDSLAYNGIILNNHYVQSTCTPSRSALLTGRYPIHTGMQGGPILSTEPRGLPLHYRLLPEYLKDLGYTTHAIGKWHIGFFQKSYTPLYRGFDSFLGFYNGYAGYYDYISQTVPGEGEANGFDLRRNESVAWDLAGRYATDVFTSEAVRLINNHDPSQPMFMYFAHSAVHGSHPSKRLEAPQSLVNSLDFILEPNRRTYAAMVSKLDESIGEVVEALKTRSMLDNSIIVFMSDNGAPTREAVFPNWGSNYPLRGAKETLWEGGVRSTSLIWSLQFQQRPRVSNQLLHISDWLPTLYTAAGGDQLNLPSDLDGVDQWYSLTWDLPSRRNQALLNINEKERTAGLVAVLGPSNRRQRSTWKLVVGRFAGGRFDEAYTQMGAPHPVVYDVQSVLSSKTNRVLSTLFTPTATEVQMRVLRGEATTGCPGPDVVPDCASKPCLFFLDRDPCERMNLAANRTDVVRRLYDVLRQLRSGIVHQQPLELQFEAAHPSRFNYTWNPWAIKIAIQDGAIPDCRSRAELFNVSKSSGPRTELNRTVACPLTCN